MSDRSKQDREKFYKGGFSQRNMLEIPEDIQAYFDKRGFVGYWLNAVLLEKNGGWDSRGWQPFTVPEDIRAAAQPKPGEYSERFDVRPDGTVRRDDLILCFMPKAKYDANWDAIKERTKSQEQLLDAALDKARSKGFTASGSAKKVRRPTNDDILED